MIGFLLFRLELVLCKSESGKIWTEIVLGDTRGEKVDEPPPMQVSFISSLLAWSSG